MPTATSSPAAGSSTGSASGSATRSAVCATPSSARNAAAYVSESVDTTPERATSTEVNPTAETAATSRSKPSSRLRLERRPTALTALSARASRRERAPTRWSAVRGGGGGRGAGDGARRALRRAGGDVDLAGLAVVGDRRLAARSGGRLVIGLEAHGHGGDVVLAARGVGRVDERVHGGVELVVLGGGGREGGPVHETREPGPAEESDVPPARRR